MEQVHANEEEFNTLSTKGDFKQVAPISTRNELKILQHLGYSASVVIKNFPTTLEEDNKILEDKTLTMNVRNCVLMRRGEKEVSILLTNFDSWFSTCGVMG